MAGQRRVVEGDLGVEADEPLDRDALGAVLADDRKRVDLDEVGVVGQHRPEQALGDRRTGLPVRAEADLEGELAGGVVGQPEQRVGMLVDDRLGPFGGDLFDLDAALRGPDEHEPLRRAVEQHREVVLLDDLGRRTHQDAPDRQALDLERQDLGGDVLRLVGGACELHAAGFPPAADEHLRLDHHLAGGVGGIGEECHGGCPGLGRRQRDLPWRDGQALGYQQGLGVGFVDLQRADSGMGGPGSRW